MVGRSRQHASLHPRKKPTKKRRAGDLSVSLRKRRCRRVFALLLALAGSLVSSTAFAQVPTGADVVAGSAAISAAGNALNVDASSARTIVNWDQFSIGAGNAANFNLPDANSAILNRVTGADLSTINGALNSNGHVFLVNPNGIMVGNSGVVNTNGFTASVFDVGNADFMAGGPLRFSGDSNASIVNNGLISTGAGGANLIANSIANNGTIESVGGNITLAGGGEVTLSNGVTYVQPSLDTLASGISPTANLIQNEGTIRATGAATSGGEVYLVNPNGKILHDGTIAAQNVASDETSTGGHVQLEASDITLADGSIIDATGTNGGGEVLVGGDWQGTGNMHQATTVMMESGATIDASATQQGDGGKVVLWSDIFDDDSVTTVMGTLIARAGDLIGGLVGNGGKIETSGHDLRIDGARVDAGSILGAAGLWLLDPDNYTIDATAAANIGTALSTTDVTVTTASGGAFGGTTVAGSGDILVDSSISKSGGSGTTTLTLQADRSVVMQPGASINGVSGAPLNVVLWANNDESLDGSVTLRSVNTQGGHLYVGGGAASTTWNGLTVPDGAASSYDIAGAPVTFAGDVNTGGGDVSIWAGSEGTGAINLSGASSINSGSGDITLIADDVTGTSLAITSTGHFTFKPNGNAWTGFGSVFDYDGTISGNTFTGSPSQNVNWLTINNYNTLGGLTLGKTGNTSGIAIDTAFSIAGPINLLGGNIVVAADLTTQNSSITAAGRAISLATGVGLASNGGDISLTASGAVGTTGADYLIDLAGTIVAGGGDIDISSSFASGGVSGSTDRAIAFDTAQITTSGAGAISITGDATNNPNTGNTWGIQFNNTLIQTDSGAIDTTGTGGYASGNSRGIVVDAQALDVLSSSGAITFRDAVPTGLTGTYNGMYLRPDSANNINIGADGTTVATSSSNITIQADKLTFDNLATNLTTSGSVAIESVGTSFLSGLNLGLANVADGLASLRFGKSGNTATLTINRDYTTVGQQDYYGPLLLNADLTLESTSGDISFHAAVDSTGATRDLTVDAGTADAVFNGTVGGTSALDTLTVNSTANVNADVTTSGAQTWSDNITLGGAGSRTLAASSLTTQAIAGGAKDFSLIADAIDLQGNLSSSGALTIAPKTSGTNIGIASVNGTLRLDSSELSRLQDGFSSVTIGSAAAGSVSVGSFTGLANDTILQAGASNDLTVEGAISWSGDHALTLAAGDDIWIDGDINVGGSNASLNLLYGGTDGTSAPGSNTNYYIDLSNRRTITFADANANLKIGNEDYTLIDSVAGFIGMSASGRYALADELDLSGTTYSAAVFDNTFSGKFDGLGNAADGMTIRNSTGGNLGLFAELNGSTVRHLGVTNFSIRTNSQSDGASGSEYRVGGLAGNIGGSGSPVTSVTSLDGVWSSGVLSTEQGSKQKFFFGGGLLGSQNGGFLDLTRSYSTANVSTQGSYSNNLATGGLIGDIGINTNLLTPHSQASSSVVDFRITKSYSTGSIVQGTYGAYYGSGGIVGVIFTSGGELTDSYSWSNVVGSGSFGGIAGYALSGTYARNYTTQSSIGAGNVAGASSYTGTTLPSATNNGTQLPSGWSSDDWAFGDRPTLKFLPIPPQQLYVRVGTGTTAVYGNPLNLSYIIVDEAGTAITFGTGNYSGLTGTDGTGYFTVGDGARAGSYNSVSYLSGLGLTGADAESFTLNPYSTSGSLTVTPRPLTLTLSNTGVTKVYDGTTAAPSGFTPTFTVGNLASGDSAASINHTSAVYNDADVADATKLTVGGLSIGGITGANGSITSDYSLAVTAIDVAATITQKALSLTGLTFDNKTYDGTTAATINNAGTLAGAILGDNVGYSYTSAVFDNANVGTNKDVSLSGIALSGTDAGNYSLPISSISGLADITTKTITLDGFAASNKVYDGTTIASISSAGTLAGIVSGDTVTVTNTGATFASKHVGTAKTVTLGGVALAGADAGNYTIASSATTSADISPKQLTIDGFSAANKIYDGTTNASITGYGTLQGIVSGDIVTTTGATAQFVDRNVGNNKSVSLSGVTLGGTDGANYTVSSTGTATANITPKALNITGLTVADKTYDATTSATVTNNGSLSGVVSGDTVTISSLAAAFADKNVGTDKSVATTSVTLGGTHSGNYTFGGPATTTADITPATLNVTGLTANSKVYDGTTSAALSGTATVSPLGSDTVSVTGTPTSTFASKNAGTGISVTISGFSLTGSDAFNYIIAQPSSSADITPAPLTIAANNDAKFVTKADAANFAGVQYDGFVLNESASDLSGTLSITRAGGGTDEAAGSYANALVASGLTSANYDITYEAGDYTIVPADELLIRFGNSTDTYTGTNAFSFLSAEYMNSGNVVTALSAPSVSGNTYTFDDGANGSAVITIEATGATTSTGGLLNIGSYTLGTTNVTETHSNFNDNVTIVGSHTVTRTELTPTVSGATKVYDGTTSLAGQTLGATGVGSGDIVNIAGVGSFASKNAGTGLGYSVENLAISGADANNYFLGSTSTSATDGTITPKAVTLTAPTLTKVYDGNTSGTATATHLAQLNAALGVAGDYVNSLTLTFDDKNVGTGKTLTPSSATIVDGNGGNNYSITYGTNNTSSITRLDNVTWIGGPTGDWSDPANWAGGAIPDLANVANVIIPEGSTPTFDNTVAGPVEIDSLTGGNFAIDSGTLEVADDFSVTGFTQNGGDLDVGGDFTTTGSFTQSPGATLAVDGDADITHSNGDLTVHSLDADNATLHSTNGGIVLGDVDTTGDLTVQADSGDITQTPTSDLTVGGEATLAADDDITLDGNNNDFQGTVNADGDDVILRDSEGDLTLGDVQTTGDLDVTSADGDITQNADSTISVAGKTTLDAAGDIDLSEGTNQFTGPVNLDGNNIEVTQSNGDITLGTVNADGNFWVDAPNGGINQNPGTTITTGGSTTLFAGGAVNLPGSNNFGGNVTTNSVVFNVNSIVPFTTILAGAALGGSASEKIAQSTYDAFVRYVTGENDGEDAPIFTVDTAEILVEEFARWVGRIDTNWLETAEALDEAGEIYIRRKKRVDGDEVS